MYIRFSHTCVRWKCYYTESFYVQVRDILLYTSEFIAYEILSSHVDDENKLEI